MDSDRKKDLNTKLLDGDDPEGIINYGRKDSKEHSWKCCTKLNNKTVLFIVCCLFACFASAEMTGALVRMFFLSINATMLKHNIVPLPIL